MVKGFTQDGHVLLENGQTLAKDYRNFTLGYYRTSHSSQGKDADDVLIAQSSASFPASNEKQFYVSVSRGVERCFIYTDDKAALKEAVLQDANRLSAADIAELSHDRSLWLQARNAMSHNQLAHYEQTLDQHTEMDSAKGKDYESTEFTLGEEFSTHAESPGGYEPGI